jgi:leader peptidase (prepilin peptidase)/N-methyltransferase
MAAIYLFPLYVFILGAAVGSFLNVVAYRLPAGKSVVRPPSHCPACGVNIRWYDNIPIFSWLFLRGRCRSCGIRISIQYPLVELANGLISLALFLRFGPTLSFLVLFALCSALVVITAIDLHHQIIPDVITLPGIVMGFALSFIIPGHSWLNSLLGILIGGGSLWLVIILYYLVKKEEGMGFGDVKFLAMLGAFLGWRSIPFIIFVASLVGAVVGVILMKVQKKDGKLAIPFGPFLAAGALLFIFYGPQIIHWYLGLGR